MILVDYIEQLWDLAGDVVDGKTTTVTERSRWAKMDHSWSSKLGEPLSSIQRYLEGWIERQSAPSLRRLMKTWHSEVELKRPVH